MKEVRLSHPGLSTDTSSFLASLATILEVPPEHLPIPPADSDPSTDAATLAWLGARGIGLVPVADPEQFAWPGPWIARLRSPDGQRRSVVMYGRSPSGLVWDPAGGGEGSAAAVEAESGELGPQTVEAGFVLAPEDIAFAHPLAVAATPAVGSVEELWIAEAAGKAGRGLEQARLIPGQGVEGDRYPSNRGTFASNRPGAALTLIEAEVCESFAPPLAAEEHRRNVVTRGIRLNELIGAEFSIGEVRCRGIRLCEPCASMQRYSGRSILRPLVHRGGLRADILNPGEIRLGDQIIVHGSTAPAA
jgi:hypothetical protein